MWVEVLETQKFMFVTAGNQAQSIKRAVNYYKKPEGNKWVEVLEAQKFIFVTAGNQAQLLNLTGLYTGKQIESVSRSFGDHMRSCLCRRS
jgi:hypothetical protein